MTTLSVTGIQEKLQSRRPHGCPDSVWNRFVNFFPTLCKTGEESEFPDMIHWCDISGEEGLEISYSHQYITIFIDCQSIEICDHKTGIWYPQSEIISLWENRKIKTD